MSVLSARLSYAFCIAVLAFVAACAPTVDARLERTSEDTVVVTVKPTEDLYAANLAILNATTDDERCVRQQEEQENAGVACRLGDIPAGESAQVIVTATDEVFCTVWAYSDPARLNTLKPYPCRAP